MGREQDYGRLYCETLIIGDGITATFATEAGRYGFEIHLLSGSSLSIGGPSFQAGSSFTAGVTFPFLYTLPSSIPFGIPEFVGSFNIIPTGATAIVSLARVYTNGS